MGGKSAPKAPDYTEAYERQADSSQQNTTQQNYANRPTQNTPFGQTTWETSQGIDPATGRPVTEWTQNTTLDPQTQAALDAQQGLQTGRSQIAGGMLDRIRSEFGPEVDYSNFAEKGGSPEDVNVRGRLGNAASYTSRAGDALMSQFSERMDPLFARDEAQQDAVLRARGLKPGDEAYDNALADMRRGQGDQFNQAMYQAQQLEGSEAQRLQGMDKNSLDTLNQSIRDNLGIDFDLSKFADYQRGRDVAEEQQRRGWSLNEANAIASGQQVGLPTMPSFQQAGRAETTQYGQAAGQQYQAEMDAYNAEQAAMAGMVGAITAPFSMVIPS
jgi:hypothetical protein